MGVMLGRAASGSGSTPRRARSARSATGTARTASSRAQGSQGSRRSGGARHTAAIRRGDTDLDNGRRPSPRHNGSGAHRARGSKGPRPKGRKRHLILKWTLGIIGAVLALGIGAFAYLYITTEIPEPEKFAMAQKTTVYFADGTTEVGSYATQNRQIISCEALPSYVGQAIVASENRTFYTDRGIDLKGIARALVNNITKGTRQGGSTITQQYAERYYMGETTSYVGKAREAVLALKIAQSEDKSEVLCNYMNTIYLGRGAYGIQAAAKAYFNKDAKDLTMPEAALLAGIIPSPSTWDPASDPEQAEARFERVVKIMAEDGYISKQEAAEATMPQTVEQSQEDTLGGPNGYLLTMARDELVATKNFTKEDIDTGGYRIVTTIDKDKQAIMQTVGDTRPADMPASIQVGGIATDPKTGEVVSVYAGSDYLKQQLNNATQATFQPGSTMKPFALLGAAQEGVNFNTLFNGNSGQRFVGAPNLVNNALNMNWGTINLYQATANSVNTVFMNVNEHLTPQRTAAIAHEAGIAGEIDENSMYNVLGINALTVWDLAQGHATIANNGVKNTIHMVDRVIDANDKDLYNAPNENEKVFDANDCALVQKAMQGTTTYGTAAGTSTMLGRPVAGKSGTANDEKAASFVGYTPSMLNVWAIWNPDDNGNPQVVPAFSGYGVSSTGYPAHLFQEYMSQALQGTEVEQFPTAKDSGKIGGSDGTWGLGRGSSSSSGSTSDQQNSEADKDKSDTDSSKQQDQQSGTTTAPDQQAQELAKQCLANPSYSSECPNYPGANDPSQGDDPSADDPGSTDGPSYDVPVQPDEESPFAPGEMNSYATTE